MKKRIFTAAISAVIAISSASALTSAFADYDISEGSKYTEFVFPEHATVFDLIAIKRDILAGNGNYTQSDYEYYRDFLLRMNDGSKKYARKVAVSFNTEGLSLKNYNDPSVLDTKFCYVGSVIKSPLPALEKEGCHHAGWSYDGVNYKQGAEFTVPDHNVVFTPYWNIYRTITYLAGDFDDIAGQNSATTQGVEGNPFDLAESSRFSRIGYSLAGWQTPDGTVYGCGERIIVPDSDLKLTAVWKPAKVEISISANNGKVLDRITQTGITGEEFVLPECTFTNGDKTFAGWDYNGTVYQPGEGFTLPALLKGKKVVIVAQWK